MAPPTARQRVSNQRVNLAATRFHLALVDVVIQGARELMSPKAKAWTCRRLVNFLRGNQAPDPALPPPSSLFGLLATLPARSLHDLTERLLDEGLFKPDAAVSMLDADVLARLFPPRPRLGSNGVIEERLRLLRRELAAGERRAPYGIFPNAALALLAARRPQSMAELSEIPGLGEARLRKYGKKILAVCARGNSKRYKGAKSTALPG